MFGGKKSAAFVFVTLLCIVIYVLYEYVTKTDKHLVKVFLDESQLLAQSAGKVMGKKPTLPNNPNYHYQQPTKEQFESLNITCTDPIWCNVPMPSRSLFRFPTPPHDRRRWRQAQVLAASGEPALLRKIVPHFPNYMDFLDGDILFRSTHMNIDYFMGKDANLTFLTVPPTGIVEDVNSDVRPSRKAIPVPYHAQLHQRAPVVRAGYAHFKPGDNNFFQGRKTGEVIVNLPRIIMAWEKVKNNIQTPFIMLSAFNENWGLLSGPIPNRTANWMPWPSRRAYVGFQNILNHNKTLLFLINQHTNFSHPKLVNLPRGVPGYVENHKRLLWDLMMDEATNTKLKAESFVFLASSDWGHRPQIKECIRRKFPVFQATASKVVDSKDSSAKEITVSEEEIKEQERRFHSANGLEFHGFDIKLQGRISSEEYYQKLIRAKVSIAVPGLGYDTFRLWESLTLGVVAVTERGVGLDKTVWRLPVLLVDDFADVTPTLLRMAYVEAVYRASEFEFHRLTQSFWWTFITKVSTSQSSQHVYETFPPEADNQNFARPAVYFTCHRTNSCGPRTKRIPKNVC